MTWRTPAAVAAGLLLTAPLMLALGTALYPVREPGPDGSAPVVPMLSWEESRRLQTFDRPCQTQEDCDAPLGCTPLNPGGPRVCLASECMTDVQCEEGFTCQALPTLDRERRVRFCTPLGRRKEGEPCMKGLGILRNACEQGLICAAWCGRPCELDASGSCPEGFYCRQGPDGPSCLPTCEGRSCPDGQQCIPIEGRTSVCAAVRGQNCKQQPCPEGQECMIHFPRAGKQGVVMGMECVQPCDEKAPCPEGLVCAGSSCRRPCEPGGASTCGPDEACTSPGEGQRAVCQLRLKT